ncbi:hypothetical protein [Streptomyces sp. NPDC056491]|uniref:hypothetical protein n=1 Tax=Streptomyces sp. NPDC056491 TaxID=3345837 RepID=UPI0036A50B2B
MSGDSRGPDKGRQGGYWLDPAATALALALVEQAFRLQGIDHVEGVHDPANLASAPSRPTSA